GGGGEGGGAGEVGTANFDDVRPGRGLGMGGVGQGLHRRHQPLLDAEGRGHVHGGRERVVRRLRHVDVVVGVDRLVAAERLAGDLGAAGGGDPVWVHVELGAAAVPPHGQRTTALV